MFVAVTTAVHALAGAIPARANGSGWPNDYRAVVFTALTIVIAPETGVVCILAPGLGRGCLSRLAAAGCTLGIILALATAALGLAAVQRSEAVSWR